MFKKSIYKVGSNKGKSNLTKTKGDGKEVIAKTSGGVRQLNYRKRIASQGLKAVDTIDLQIEKAIKA